MQKAHSFYAVGFVFWCPHSEGTKKKTRSFYAAGLLFTSLEIGCLFDLYPGNRLTGKLLPRRGFLTAYTVRTPQTPLPETHPYFTQRTVQHPDDEDCRTQNVMAVSDFCDIALAPFSGGANLSLAEGRWLGPRVNVKLTRGLSTSGLRVFPPTISRKHPRVIYRFFVTPAILPVNSG